MKLFETIGLTGSGVWDVLAGPNHDYDGQSDAIKSIVAAGGNGRHVELRLVDCSGGTVKKRKFKPDTLKKARPRKEAD